MAYSEGMEIKRYVGLASVPGWGHKAYEVEAYSVYGATLAIAREAYAHVRVPASSVTDVREVVPEYACGICGEREGSEYAERCCENQDWVEV